MLTLSHFKVIFLLCWAHTSVSGVSPHPKVILITFDGIRYDYLRKTDTPNLHFIKENGASVPYVTSTFVTKTYPNYQSIATGLWPESHGIVDNDIWSEELGRVLTWKDEEFYRYRDDIIPIWIRNEWAGEGRRSGVIMYPGSVFPFGVNDSLPSHLVTYEENLPFTWRIDKGIQWLTEEDVNLLMIYIEEPDYAGHGYGPDSLEVVEMIERLDWTVGYLLERLREVGLFDQVNLVFCSDHGMQEVNLAKGVIDMSPFVTMFRRRVGSSPVWSIEPNLGELETTYQALKNYSELKFFEVYKKAELPPEWHMGGNERTLPLIIVAEPGWVFSDYSVSSSIVGVHGYDNFSPLMRPFFLAHGPRFKSQFEGTPFHNIDIFPLLCELLGIPEPKNNGSLSRVQDLLRFGGVNGEGSRNMGNQLINSIFVFILTIFVNLQSSNILD